MHLASRAVPFYVCKFVWAQHNKTGHKARPIRMFIKLPRKETRLVMFNVEVNPEASAEECQLT